MALLRPNPRPDPRLPEPEPRSRRLLFRLSQGSRPWNRAWWQLFLTALVVQSDAARGRRIGAAVAFWRAQARRLRGRPYLVDLGGERGVLRCPPTSSIAPLVAAVGYHEFDEQLFFERIVRPGDVVIDAGSSVGFFAVPLGRRGARVACFEPADETRRWLEENVALNQLGDAVAVFDVALGDFDGTARLTTGLDSQNHLVIGDAAAGNETALTEVRTIDSMADEHPWLAEATFVKVDVEGFDEAVLRGAARLLRERRPVLLVETRGGGGATRQFLAELGYDAWWYDGLSNALVAFPEAWAGNFGFHTNMVFLTGAGLEEMRTRLGSDSRPRPPRPRLLRG